MIQEGYQKMHMIVLFLQFAFDNFILAEELAKVLQILETCLSANSNLDEKIVSLTL